MSRRRPLTQIEKIASALLAIKRGSDWLIPEPVRSCGDPWVIAGSVEWHHIVPVAIGGTNAPHNVIPILPDDHAEETAKRTIPTVAKGKRIKKDHDDFRRKMLAKSGQPLPEADTRHASRWPSRPMPGSRKSGMKKPMRGPAVRRESV